ncbi:hypothetical protein [Clostridium sp. AWRP]|uniref:hypothetical protein n=1 Tax=Clostridium sp. AWRP TaxID=2212991 RepID=UPI000FDBAD52|nr:hypothetical protein [Clostridium sp. AWRP]AZV56044.1 hypothetical protein DMR38_05210 [Clostridium sp. AWRP]
MAREITGTVSWPQAMKDMLEVQRRFTKGLGLMIEDDVNKKKINMDQLDFIIEELGKCKWHEPILRTEEN